MEKFIIDGELQDDLIILTLNQCITDYQNGEIAETADTLREIVNAIDEFYEYWAEKLGGDR